MTHAVPQMLVLSLSWGLVGLVIGWLMSDVVWTFRRSRQSGRRPDRGCRVARKGKTPRDGGGGPPDADEFYRYMLAYHRCSEDFGVEPDEIVERARDSMREQGYEERYPSVAGDGAVWVRSPADDGG